MKKVSAIVLCMIIFISFFGCDKELSNTLQVMYLPSEYTDSIIENELLVNGVRVSDGYLVANAESEEIHVKKYDLQGELIWDKEYFSDSRGEALSITTTFDEGFVLGVTTYTYQDTDGNWVETPPIVEKCDKEGNVLWTKTYNGFSDTTIDKIFCLSNGDIFTIGYTEAKSAETENLDDIYISKLDNNGNLTSEKYYGGFDYESLCDAEYIDGVGIVALIYTQSDNGTFSASKDGDLKNVVAVIDSNLEISWQKSFLLGSEMTIYDNNIYILNYNFTDVEYGERYKDYKLRKMDLEGNLLFIKDFEKIDNISIIKGSTKGVLLKYPDKLLLLDENGNEKTNISFKADCIEKIIEYDNYFLILSTNNTGTLEQPLEISLIWYSTELVYSGYDYNGELLWRESFDNTPEYMKNYKPEKGKGWIYSE